MHLDSFHISGFRAFSEIQFENFSRVNLLVGKNNVGKTTVLEALRIYLTQDPLLITELLVSREEFSVRKRRRRQESALDLPLAFESLFYGRPSLDNQPKFSVGPTDARPLTINFTWMRRIVDDANSSIRYIRGGADDNDTDPDVYPGFNIEAETSTLLPLERLERMLRRRLPRPADQSIVYLPSTGMSPDDLGKTWDSVALTADEEIVITTLRSIVPTLEKLVLIQSPNRPPSRILMAKLSEFTDPVPFASFGEGTLHMLNLVLGLANARNGVLLIDEIENGLHYTIQERLWEMILRQAKTWNVQVFATTHSWDCVRGLQGASNSLFPNDIALASLFRLDKIGNRFNTTLFSSDELKIARYGDIEVR